jgi:hypothetical protein
VQDFSLQVSCVLHREIVILSSMPHLIDEWLYSAVAALPAQLLPARICSKSMRAASQAAP